MTRSDAPWRNEGLLRQKYLEEQKTTTELANKWGCTTKTISNWLEEFGIDTRSQIDYCDNPWHDKDKLYQKYIEERKTFEEIADEWGTHPRTIGKYIHRHNIPTRNKGDYDGGPWRDRDTLYQKYVVERKHQSEVADELGCDQQTVSRWLRRHGIATRPPGQLKHPRFGLNTNGYEVAQTYSTVYDFEARVPIHRLIALMEGELEVEEFYDEEVIVHHKNKLRWDNRPENLEVMTNSEHAKHHQFWEQD
jgi:transposase-like protein